MFKTLVAKFFRNKKKGSIYGVLGNCINATNAQNGERGILYFDNNATDPVVYYRSRDEFKEKFDRNEEYESGIKFRNELQRLINFHGLDSRLQTPDYIIADTIMGYLEVYSESLAKRQNHMRDESPKLSTQFLLRKMGEDTYVSTK